MLAAESPRVNLGSILCSLQDLQLIRRDCELSGLDNVYLWIQPGRSYHGCPDSSPGLRSQSLL